MRQVVVSDRARAELLEACQWWAQHRSAEQAGRWYEGFLRALEGLALTANSCPLADENGVWPFEVRQRNYGLGRRPTHRAIFTIRPDMIYVLRIQSLSQDRLQEGDF